MLKTATIKATYPLLINGEYVNSSTEQFFETHNPATGDVLAKVAKATKEDVDRAVKAARRAFDSGKWPKLTPARRARVLNKIAQIMRERFNELVEAEVLNSGKTVAAAQGQITQAIEDFEFYAGAIQTLGGQDQFRTEWIF